MRFDSNATRRALAGLAAAVACALLCACSSSSSGAYPNLFDPPPSPNDTALTPDQVKQAMDNLVSDRNQLCSAVTSKPPGSPPPDCVSGAVTGTPAAGAGPRP